MKRLTLVLLALVFAFGTFSCQTEDTPEPQTKSDSPDFDPSPEKKDHLTADAGQDKVFYIKEGELKDYEMVFTLSQPAKLRITGTNDKEVSYDIYHFKGNTVGFKKSSNDPVDPGKSFEGVYKFDYTTDSSLSMTFLSDSLGRTAAVQNVKASTSINTTTDTSGNGGTDTTGIVDSTLTKFAQDLYFEWNLDTAASTIRDTSWMGRHDGAYVKFEDGNGDEVKVTISDGNALSIHSVDSVSIKDGEVLGYTYIIQSFKTSNPIKDFYLPNLQATDVKGWYITVINQNQIKIEQKGTIGCSSCGYTEMIFTK